MENLKEKEKLLQEIERYFDCLLSDEDESILVRKLATTEINHPAVNEAKALMGFRTMEQSISKLPQDMKGVKRTNIRLRIMQAAACLLLLIMGVGYVSYSTGSDKDSECLAYVNGSRVSDDEAVMELIMKDITELNQGLDEAREDVLDEIEIFQPIAEMAGSGVFPEDI
ncbi:MAG: hypothetical protein K2K58_04880 [Muribaculaceae bacterium]|nr:hypothetical protein [Muribaculaceae bacterium]